MSTRSTITLINPDLSAKQVYCHNDGYLAFNGALLHNCYNTPYKVAKLISHGNMSSLGYTSKQSRAEHDIDLMDKVNGFKIAEDLGYSTDSKVTEKILDACDALRDGATFYYGRDRGEHTNTKPVSISPTDVAEEMKRIGKLNHHHFGANDFRGIQGVILPGGMIEYNYVYNASLARPCWYVCYLPSTGRYKDCWLYEKLSTALRNPKVRNDSRDLGTDKKSAEEFFKHPYNPTYQEFLSNLRLKYSKHGVKPSIKQNIISPQQLKLF